MNRKKILILLLAAIFIGLFFWFDLGRYLTLESLKQNRNYLVALYRDHPIAMVAVFMAIYIIQTALALPGAAILSLAAGAIFGALMGTVYANIAATIGATLAFLVTRYLLRDTVLDKFGPRLEGINQELDNAGFNYLLFLRLVPLFPFFLINLAAGLTRLPLRTFFFGTMLGIIPGGFVFCQCRSQSGHHQLALGEIASPRVLGSFALLGLFALIPVIYGKIRGAKKPSDQGIQSSEEKDHDL